MTTQAPHAIRTVFALVAGHVGLSEEKIRIISPDLGGGFGGKVPIYPGYVIAVAASVVIGKPIKLQSLIRMKAILSLIAILVISISFGQEASVPDKDVAWTSSAFVLVGMLDRKYPNARPSSSLY